MALQEGPEADWWNPQIDVLAGFHLQPVGNHDGDLEPGAYLIHLRSREASSETGIAV